MELAHLVDRWYDLGSFEEVFYLGSIKVGDADTPTFRERQKSIAAGTPTELALPSLHAPYLPKLPLVSLPRRRGCE